MKQNFRGWTAVFGFTFRQSTSGKAFKLMTAFISIVIIGAIIAAILITGKPESQKSVEVSSIKKVLILDNSGLIVTNYKQINPELQNEQFKNIEYTSVKDQSRDDVIKAAAKDSDSTIALIISPSKTGFELEAIIPSGSLVSKGEAQTLVQKMSDAFTTSKLIQSGLSSDQLAKAMAPIVTSYTDIGENKNGAVYAIKLIAPMLFCFMFYMMLMLYGQTISKSVSTEKTSKLMETLLTSIHPYALITGKILAVTTMALMQFVIWIASCFIGLYGGNAIAHTMYPGYKNIVIFVLDFLKDNIGKTALSPVSIVLAILFFCIGFLFYCVIAGLAGCMVSKPDEVASAQQLFILPIVVSFLITYLAPMYNNQVLLKAIRYIPFTAPFCVPADLMTGTLGIGEGILTLGVLSLFCILIIMLSGRLYKGLILYSGQKPSLKMIGNVLKNNN